MFCSGIFLDKFTPKKGYILSKQGFRQFKPNFWVLGQTSIYMQTMLSFMLGLSERRKIYQCLEIKYL